MNCDYLRENLLEYLDGSLLPSDQAAAEKHLADCPQCREAVQQESKLAREITRGMEQAVEGVGLQVVDRRRMARAVERQLGDFREQPLGLFWKRMAWSFAMAAIVLVAGIWTGLHFRSEQNSKLEAERKPALFLNRESVIHFVYTVPEYTFRREGNQVVDALTSETIVAEQSLAQKNEKTRTGETYYEN
jgi:anti-sigma factor RsiW